MLTLPFQLMMNFLVQVAHRDVFVVMESDASHCFVRFSFVNTFRLKVMKGINTLALGNGDQW